MVRSVLGFAGFFVLLVIGMKVIGVLLGGLIALVFQLLWFAFLGWVVYRIIRLLSPATADRIRDTVKGRTSEV
jgi:uncharacterized protein (DUF983 family)